MQSSIRTGLACLSIFACSMAAHAGDSISSWMTAPTTSRTEIRTEVRTSQRQYVIIADDAELERLKALQAERLDRTAKTSMGKSDRSGLYAASMADSLLEGIAREAIATRDLKLSDSRTMASLSLTIDGVCLAVDLRGADAMSAERRDISLKLPTGRTWHRQNNEWQPQSTTYEDVRVALDFAVKIGLKVEAIELRVKPEDEATTRRQIEAAGLAKDVTVIADFNTQGATIRLHN